MPATENQYDQARVYIAFYDMQGEAIMPKLNDGKPDDNTLEGYGSTGNGNLPFTRPSAECPCVQRG